MSDEEFEEAEMIHAENKFISGIVLICIMIIIGFASVVLQVI
jgi:hypothetical protein